MSGGRRLNEAERVEVMLSVLPWLAAKGGAPLAEVATHFGVDAARLRADLDKVFLDVEPAGAGSLVDVLIDEDDDDFVTVVLPGSFEEPPHLDHNEALLLLAAGTAMLGERGTGLALEPAVEKLVAALGDGAETAIAVDLGAGDPAMREVLRTAVNDRHTIEIHYFSWGSDEVTTRTVDPWALRSVDGHWYLTGRCHDRDAMRHFRLDRMLDATARDSTDAFDPPAEIDLPDAGFATGARIVALRIPTEATWVIESFPVQTWRDDGDTVEVTLAIHHDRWLDRVLLALPPEVTATDVATGEDLHDRGAAAAQQILERHADGDGTARR